MKKKIKTAVCCALALLGSAPLVADLFGAGTISQYAYNFAYLFVALPACIGLSGIMEREHPELFGGDGRRGA